MDNKSKSDRIHDLLPALLASKQDQNWSALVGAIGAEDDRLAKLIEQVRNQFFVRTASRPHLDRLAANNNISRPKFIGISDADFRNYVPVLAYQPKQVKKIVDTLLDLFFFKESTTAFLSSSLYEPYALKDKWDLTLKVDNLYLEYIKFTAADFTDIANATGDEVVAAYNRQAKYSYATNYFDSITNHNYIRIFTNTVGTQGSLEIIGGLANICIQLNGFLSNLGTGANTQWNVSKVGDTTTFTYTGGTNPGLDKLQVGDIFLCDIPGNTGSFPVIAVDIQNNKFQFTNLFATVGNVTQTSSSQTKFIRPEKVTSYRNVRRALAWETQSSKVTVEMPATPSIVQRGAQGGFHINGSNVGIVTQINAVNSLTVTDASSFPTSGYFVIEPLVKISTHLTGGTGDESTTYSSNGRTISNLTRYSYTSIAGNTLYGITPNLPSVAQLNEVTITSMTKSNGIVTCQCSNNFIAGERVAIRGGSGISVTTTTATTTTNSPTLSGIGSLTSVAPGMLISGSGIPAETKVLSITGPSTVIMSQSATLTGTGTITFSENTNGAFEIASATTTQFTYKQLGLNGTVTTPGTALVERTEFAGIGSKVIVTTSRSSDNTKIVGPYVWNEHAPFVLSSNVANSTNAIVAGKVVKLLDISANTIPNEEGYLIFDYGKNNQEGPVRYLYKPADNVLALDPSYVFQQNHASGCSIVALSHKGPHIPSGLGKEYPPYLTNPSDARLILQDLIKSVTSAGIFIDFLVRYPTQLYDTISVYG